MRKFNIKKSFRDVSNNGKILALPMLRLVFGEKITFNSIFGSVFYDINSTLSCIEQCKNFAVFETI